MAHEHDLLKKFLALRERVHSLLEDTISPLRLVTDTAFNSTWSPPVDLYETEKEFVLMAELPGVNKEDLDLQMVERVVILKGERRSPKDVCGQNYHRLERPVGRFERRFELPDAVESAGIKAKMADGVLTVALPKKSPGRSSIKVEVNRK